MTTTTTPTTTTPTAASDAQAGVDAGLRIGVPRPVNSDASRHFTVVVPEGARLEHVDVDELDDRFAEFPHRKSGTRTVYDAESFLTYLDRHGCESTEVYANPRNRTVTAVLNAGDPAGPGEGVAGHGDHRCTLVLHRTPEWQAWLDHDREWMDQETFATHLEDNALEVASPDAATMLEIATTLQGSTGVEWKRGVRTTDGQVQLNYIESAHARAGQSGDLEIPAQFTLELSPFLGTPPIQVEARFRYRARQGTLALAYALSHATQVEDEAFHAGLDQIRGDTRAKPFPVMAGTYQ